jgi:general stress protein 26
MPEPTRPNLQNYGVMTDPEGMLDWSWVDAQMAQSRNYWVCSVRPDGRPHAVPVWGVWLDGTLYFGSQVDSRKSRNIAANPQVVVHLESGDDTVIFEGTLETVTDPAQLTRIAQAMSTKYDMELEADPPGQVMYRLKPAVAFGWLEKDFLKTPTRWRFD